MCETFEINEHRTAQIHKIGVEKGTFVVSGFGFRPSVSQISISARNFHFIKIQMTRTGRCGLLLILRPHIQRKSRSGGVLLKCVCV